MRESAASRSFLRLRRAVTTWPDRAGWRDAGLIALATAATVAAISGASGLVHPAAPDLSRLPATALSVVFVPALSEELVFRGLWVADRTERVNPALNLALATLVFTAWHGVETLFLRHAAPLFLRPDFLSCAAVLGLGLGLIRRRTGSLWPAVALHWAVVVVWRTWLGGPDIAALR